MKTLASLPVLLWALTGCALPPAPGAIRLGDGVMQARSAAEAESFCRTTGDPTRLLEAPDAPAAPRGVLFRCD